LPQNASANPVGNCGKHYPKSANHDYDYCFGNAGNGAFLGNMCRVIDNSADMGIIMNVDDKSVHSDDQYVDDDNMQVDASVKNAAKKMQLSAKANEHSMIYHKQKKNHERRTNKPKGNYNLTKQHWLIFKKHGMIDEYPTFAQTGGIDPYAAKHHFEIEDWRKYCTSSKFQSTIGRNREWVSYLHL